MEQNNVFATDTTAKKMIFACGAISLILGTLGIANMLSASYGIAGLAFGAGAITSIFGMYRSAVLISDKNQNIR